jgi:hypothetical protein
MQKLLFMALVPVLCCSCAQRGIMVAHPAVAGTSAELTSAPVAKSHTVADPYGPQNAIVFDRTEGGEANSCGCGPGLDPKSCKTTEDQKCTGHCYDSEGNDKGSCGVQQLHSRSILQSILRGSPEN